MTDVRDDVATTKATQSQGNFIWYELITPDPDGSKAFYDAVVGWDIEPAPAGPMDYRMIRRSDGGNAGGVLRLTPEMAQHGARPVWLGYLNVDDVDSVASAIEQEGGKIQMPPSDIPDVGRIAMVTDPQGAPFYIMKPIPPAGDPNAKSDVFSVDQPQHVRWNELSTSDQDGALDFYARHFGIRQEGAMDMGEMGEYRFIFKDELRIGAVMRKPPQMPVSLWSFYFGVDDIDRAADALTKSGGAIHHGPVEIPGGEFTIIASDPQGAAFGIVGPRKS
jgi:predicted enzyme related to lactoylglutathione lyase